ncbi:hypothetical protein [Nocardia sp. AG03]|uniref:hypothetical protein n=1 Tax=Nocardia sp. AG03 TaxID=3025312 RepID=UPI0024187C14|nr:hypothetical protein [Nocardia sp. AG03]
MGEASAVGAFLNEVTIPGTVNNFDDGAAPDNDLLADGVDYRDSYYQEDNPVLKNVGRWKVDESDEGDKSLDPGIMKGTLVGDVMENGYGLQQALTTDGSLMDKAEAIMKASSTGADVVDAVKMFTKAIKGATTLAKFDPFNFLGSQLMSWMLEHVEPMRKTLESLTGSPDMVQAYSDSWKNIGEALTTTAQQYAAAIDSGIGAWAGAAADAYKASATELTGKIAENAALAGILKDANDGMKRIVEAVRGVVVEVLSNLAGMLAEITALLIASAGTATPALIARALFDISASALTISALLKELSSAVVSLKGLVQAGVQTVRGIVEIQTAKA